MPKKHDPKTGAADQIDDPAYHLRPYRWVMLALLWMVYFCFGVVLRTPSLLVTPMLRDLNMSYSQMGVVLGSWQATYIAFAVISGVIIDKWGLRFAIFTGSLIIGLSSALRYYATGFGTLLIFVAMFGIGGPMISIGAPKMISLWFKGKDRGTALGIYITGPYIGAMMTLAGTNAVIMPLVGFSWRSVCLLYGVMTFGFALFWWFFAREAAESGPSERFNPVRVLIDLLKVHNVRILLLCGPLSFTISHGYQSWLPKILENTGLSPSSAGFASAIPFVSAIPAVLFMPRLVPQRMRARIIALMSVVLGLSIMWVVALDMAMIVGLLISGVCWSCLFPLMLLILMDSPEVGSRYLGSVTGVLFCVSEMGGFLGPFLIGFLVDFTGTFISGSVFFLIICLIIASLMFLLKPAPAIADNGI